MNSILIIGAGFLQSFVIKKAKEMGYRTLTIDKNPFSVGFAFADECDVVDIIDQEACLEYARSKKIDGVMTAATDYGVLSAAYIAQQLHLPGLDYEVAKVIKNKSIVRKILFENVDEGVSQYYEVSSLSDISKIKNSIKYPIMVKPCDGSGSKAARRVDKYDQLTEAVELALNASLIGKALIEEFIVGKEYGVESFVYDGEVHVLGVMGKHMTSPPYYSELGHFMPSGLSFEDKVKGVVQKSIKALGINYGAVNMDVLITKDEKVHIVDVGARMGGNLIGSHIIPIGTGIDYMDALIDSAVGNPVHLPAKTSGKNVATRLLALTPGVVMELPNFEEIEKQFKVEIYHHLKVRDSIHEYHNNLDGCGYVVAVDDDLREAEKNAEEAKTLIDNGIIRVE